MWLAPNQGVSGQRVEMKHLCPHCNQRSISSWAKFNSSSLHPAVCPQCHEHSQQHIAGTWIESLLITFGTPAILLWALFIKSWWPIVFLVILAIASSIAKFVYVPMVAVDISRAKKQHWFAFGCLVVVFVWVVFDAIEI